MRSELGSIRERKKGVWEVRVSLGYGADGKRKTKSKTVRGTRKDARVALNALLAQYGALPMSATTLHDFLNSMYLPWHEREYPRPDAIRKIRYSIGRVVEDTPDKPLDSLSKAFCVQWCAQHPLWEQMALRAALSKAVEWEYLDRNPMTGIGDKYTRPESKKRLSQDQLLLILDAVRDTPIEAGVIIQASCGLRKAEALALDWEHIDFETGLLTVSRTWHYGSKGGWFEDTKNAQSKGKVRVPPRSLARLEEIRGTGPICTMNGKRMIPNTYYNIWRHIAIPLLGDDYVSVENLRHTHGSILFDAGVSVEFISKRLRHASTRITEKHYIRADSTADDTAADAFDDAMSA